MKGLQNAGHEISFLGSCPTLLEETAKLEIGNWKLEIGDPPVTKWGAVSFVWRKFFMKKKLLRYCATALHPDAVLMLSLSEKLLLTNWLTKRGVKVFWIEHDRVGRWLTHNPWLLRLRKLSKLATTVVVSNLSKEIYERLGWLPERIVAIPNGIEPERFFPTPDPNPNSSKLRVGCVARLTHDKGVDLLIDAVAGLLNVECTIVGTGKVQQSLQERAHRYTGIPIHFLPSVPDVADFYRSQDVIVLPSREHDPFGLVIAEAMACGTPTIVTDACGIASYLNEDESLIVKAGSSEALKGALREAQEERLRSLLREHGSQAARERFSSEKMVESYRKLLT
jgi:glycosyltransferase involved in cell wall biosynthesis